MQRPWLDSPLQAKLTMGAPRDRYELEADQIAGRVMKRIEATESLQSGKDHTVTGEPKAEKLKISPIVQYRAFESAISASPDLEVSIQRATRGSGQGLSDQMRKPMERIFGADFSGVRVHANAESDSLNRALNTRAFTTGRGIFFRQGAYEPGSKQGQELLAHELTHVVQQSGLAVPASDALVQGCGPFRVGQGDQGASCGYFAAYQLWLYRRGYPALQSPDPVIMMRDAFCRDEDISYTSYISCAQLLRFMQRFPELRGMNTAVWTRSRGLAQFRRLLAETGADGMILLLSQAGTTGHFIAVLEVANQEVCAYDPRGSGRGGQYSLDQFAGQFWEATAEYIF